MLKTIKEQDRKILMRLEVKIRRNKNILEGADQEKTLMNNFGTPSIIANILKDYIDNPLGELAFGVKYNKKLVVDAFKDLYFIAFLKEIGLITKLPGIGIDEFNDNDKIRLYAAVLNHYNYMSKEKAKIPWHIKELYYNA